MNGARSAGRQSTSGFRNVIGPLIIVGVAGAWQLAALDIVEGERFADFRPILIVVVGLAIVLGRYRGRAREVTEDYVGATGVFGGSEQRSASQSFTGADLTALFGGVELDVREAAVADPPAHVSATAMFGGVEVVVPREWNVRVDVLPIFGGAEDDRLRRETDHEEIDLVVTGFAAFGGVSVTD